MATETLQSEDGRVVRWRIERLCEAGFDEGVAAALANHRGVDLHELFTLVDRGCPPHLAARILAPLDLDPSVP